MKLLCRVSPSHSLEMMSDVQLESLQTQLSAFCSQSAGAKVPAALLDALKEAADTNHTSFDWNQLRFLIDAYMLEKLQEFQSTTGPCPAVDGESYDIRLDRLRRSLSQLDRPPFTLQRICEILLQPSIYRNTNKFFAALSKTLVGIRVSNDDLVDDDSMDAFPVDTSSDLPFTDYRAPWSVSDFWVSPDHMPMAANGAGAMPASFMALMPSAPTLGSLAQPQSSLGLSLIGSQGDEADL